MLIEVTKKMNETSKKGNSTHTTSPPNRTADDALVKRLDAAEAQVAALTAQLKKIETGTSQTQEGRTAAPAITMAAIQGKLGVRDEIVLKKVDDKILEAIARYEQKVAEQTTQKENKFTHIPKVDEIAK
jgi:hypothetical protein